MFKIEKSTFEKQVPGDVIFPRNASLSSSLQYQAVRDYGISTWGPLFRLSCLKKESVALSLPKLLEKQDTIASKYPNNGTDPFSKGGFIVSRRVGNAVVRNRVKRRLRELYRLERFHVLPDLWLVFIATPQAASASFAQLREEWYRLATKLSLF
ncbi:MAG: ribonuclease P protein component [Chthoniobacterales bacterium]|nr:ribonuclease P protein component [Chthoniobacterales bacterium]